MIRKLIIPLLLTVLGFSLLACSNGTRRDAWTMGSFAWRPASGAETCTACVTLEYNVAQSSPSQVVFDVVVRGIDNLQSLYFDLRFDPAIFAYFDFEEGALLNQNGDPTAVLVALDGLDETVLTAGASITAPGVEVSAPAEGLVLLTLYFDIEDHGTGLFDFLEAEGAFSSGIEDSTNTPLAASWYGGALIVY